MILELIKVEDTNDGEFVVHTGIQRVIQGDLPNCTSCGGFRRAEDYIGEELSAFASGGGEFCPNCYFEIYKGIEKNPSRMRAFSTWLEVNLGK